MTIGTTSGEFRYIDPASYGPNHPISAKPWGKVDGGGTSYDLTSTPRPVADIRADLAAFTIENAGFAVHQAPTGLAAEQFADDAAVRGPYYEEVEALLKKTLPGVSKVVIFDHTIRRRTKDAPRQPVQQVHVDQTPAAAAARVRRHLPPEEAEAILADGVRYQIVNVWRPIENPASDFPLAVIDWRSTEPTDFVPVDLLYPSPKTEQTTTNGVNGSTPNGTAAKPNGGVHNYGDDDRGKEAPPPKAAAKGSREGYTAKGETYGVAPNEKHRFYYVKDMQPTETMFIKCFDSWGQHLPGGRSGVAMCTPHTAFVDPETPKEAQGRQSIEVRCLVFYE